MKKKPWNRKQAESDDDDASIDFNGDESESDYDENEKLLLEKTRKELAQGPYDTDDDSEEEVFPLHNKLDKYIDSEEEDDDGDIELEKQQSDDDGRHISDSDIEGAESDTDDLPDDKAWGQLRKSFYHTDYLDKDHGGFVDAEDEETAKMEEEEARKIHQRMMAELENVDFDNELFIETKETEKGKEGTDIKNVTDIMIIEKDLTNMSDREKQKLLMKEAPELYGLISDFNTYTKCVQIELTPILNFVKSGDLPQCPFTEYIQFYYEIIMNYCTNIGFYFYMKSLRKPVQNHPIMKYLLRYREMLCKQSNIYEKIILPQIKKLVSNLTIQLENSRLNKATKNKNKKLLNILLKPVQQTAKTVKSDGHTLENLNDNEFDNSEDVDLTEVTDEMMMDSDKKRPITYQISKNKGLTPRRKKELRNPRVKNRMKYRKAKIRRKGQIREPRKEIRRYDGEISGIKVNLSKSIKIKA